LYQVDQQFHLRRDFVNELATRPVPWGGGLLSKATFYRTYSRKKEMGGQEHFHDVIVRNIEGVMRIRKTWYKLIGQRWDDREWQEKAQHYANLMFDMKWLPPGRSLYAMGTEYVYERGNAALNNCGFVDVVILSDAAAWLMDHLMLGVGVGFRIKHGGYDSLQMPVGTPYLYRIPDTREGWVESVRLLIESYEMDYAGDIKQPVLFDYDGIREKGSLIRGFGGIASGPEPLIELHNKLRAMFENAMYPTTSDGYGYGELSTQHTADVMNMIGVCVIAGNVRRSAEIAIGSPNDDEFVHMKDIGHEDAQGVWLPGPYAHRSGHSYMSNNSVWMDSDDDFSRIPELVSHIIGDEGRGEPGFINGRNIRKRGRFIDKVGNGSPWLREDFATGMNPCGEIPLYDTELCNLVETFPTRITDKAEWHRVLEAATFFASTVALLPSHNYDTNEVVAANRRIGVSVSGVADWIDSTHHSTIHRWLDDGYNTVRHTNALLADKAGVPASIRLTTVKPSGTVSLLPWVSPGVHHPVKSRFIRRITFAQSDPAVEYLQRAGVPYEPLITDPEGSYSFQFPMQSAGKGKTRSVDQVSIWEQASIASFLQRVWADNAVSFTGTVGLREVGQLEAVVSQTLPVVKALSFLVNNDEKMVYQQAPYEGITVEEYERRMKEIDQTIDWSNYGGSDGQDSRFCDGDACSIDFGG
jgi:ribonucleoside-diphosphate reductase alpha chain